MKKKIKLLMAVNSLGVGGTVIFVMNFFRHINKDEFQVDFLIFDDSRMNFADEVESYGSKVHIIHDNKKNKIMKLISQMRQVKKFLKSEHYDVIHSNSCSFFGNLRSVLPAKKDGNIKVISHAHSIGTPKETKIDNLMRGFLKRLISRNVYLGFACSDTAGKSKYTAEFLNSNKYHVIRNAVEVEKYVYNQENRDSIRKKYNIGNKTVIGNVGRLSHEKNQKYLIDIFSKSNKNNDCVLMIIGGGTLEQSLKQHVDELGLNESVIFTGSINNVNEYYSAMDVFVMPSVYEGLPFTAVEAQVNGLKCVFSDTISRMADISEESVFISLNDSEENWAEAVLKASQSRIMPEKLEKITHDYDLKNEAKRLENLYKSIL